MVRAPGTGRPPASAAGDKSGWAGAVALAAVPAACVAAVFAPVAGNGFVNWDDPHVLTDNAALAAPGVVGWAFTTTHAGHYQPLAWLVWAATRATFGAAAPAHHALSLLLHAAGAALVYGLALRLAALRLDGSAGERAQGRCAPSVETLFFALAAALLFALHPLRVEAVAWASAMPYLLALPFLLLALGAYLHFIDDGRRRWLAAALVAYGLALLARPLAPGFFVLLLLVDVACGRLRRATLRRVLAEKLPFAAAALAAAVVEASARRFVALAERGLAERLADALAAPFVYLARTLAPVGLTPLDPLPLSAESALPRLAVAFGLWAAALVLVARGRRRWPALPLLAGAYAVLLAPAAGLAPSGLQATADRYAHVPGVALALVGGGALAALVRTRLGQGGAAAVLLVASVTLGTLSFRLAGRWRDSITLWSWALEVDARNDVALYNLASALAAAGDEDGARARYRELLVLVPGHAEARENLARLEAKEFERRAGEAAAAGKFAEAARLYGEALRRDPGRMHSRASRGMALARLGQCAPAVPDLRAALEAGRDEPPLWSALAFCLAATGREDDARAALEQGLTRHPGDAGLRRNVQRLRGDARDTRSPH